MNKKAASGTLLRLLLIGMLTFAFNIQPVKAEPTALGNTDDLVACWHFDENTGSTAYDSSSNNNDGTIYGATWTSGVTGSALSFDGADDYIEVPSFQNLAFNEVTISVWVKPVSGNINNNRIITIHDGVTPDYHYFDVETTTIRSISVYIDGDEFMDHDRTLNPDIWTHIARAHIIIKIFSFALLLSRKSLGFYYEIFGPKFYPQTQTHPHTKRNTGKIYGKIFRGLSFLTVEICWTQSGVGISSSISITLGDQCSHFQA